MESSGFRTMHHTIIESVCDIPQMLKHLCFILYCRLYRLFNTCYFMQTLHSWYYGTLAFLFGDRHKLEWKTHWQSPVCRAILRRKHFLTRSKNSLSWAVCYSVISSLLFLEIKNSVLSGIFGEHLDIVWYAELFVCMITTSSAVIAFAMYAWSVLSKPMPISPIQKKLFRIDVNDPGFEVKKFTNSMSESIKPERPQFSSWRDSLECSGSPSFLSVTPINYSYNSWASRSPGSPDWDTTSSSWSFHRASSPVRFSTPKSVNNDRVSLRLLNYSDNVESSYERPIKNKKQLDDFLKEHEKEEETKRLSMSLEESKPFMSNMATIDNSPMSVLSKCRYQRSYRLPHMEAAEDDSSETHCGDSILHKLKITETTLTIWYESMRKWICQTILVKIVHEIEDINFTLTEIGLPEFQIGSISCAALHQIAVTKSQHLPTLPAILPYIEVYSNQEYIIRRLKDLAHGGCMGDFKWNSGGTYDDKRWCDDLPNDSALIMHILCCYFDAHLPPDPHFPEGKPFSSKYLKKIPEKVVRSKDLAYIYQSSVNPPQFKVVLEEDLYTLPKGRNNLFCALVIFFHHMKTKECGMLGRVNLGQSGLNILWVLD